MVKIEFKLTELETFQCGGGWLDQGKIRLAGSKAWQKNYHPWLQIQRNTISFAVSELIFFLPAAKNLKIQTLRSGDI
jgi:hypothetical protein